jgi:hypothetical protein
MANLQYNYALASTGESILYVIIQTQLLSYNSSTASSHETRYHHKSIQTKSMYLAGESETEVDLPATAAFMSLYRLPDTSEICERKGTTNQYHSP